MLLRGLCSVGAIYDRRRVYNNVHYKHGYRFTKGLYRIQREHPGPLECNTMTSWWARWRLKSPASPLFTQPRIQAQIKENITAPHHWPLCGDSTCGRWIPHTNGQYRGKCLHLMTSSCKTPETILFSWGTKLVWFVKTNHDSLWFLGLDWGILRTFFIFIVYTFLKSFGEYILGAIDRKAPEDSHGLLAQINS